MEAHRCARLGKSPGGVGADRANRGNPARADTGALFERAGERTHGIAGVIEDGDAPLFEEPPLLQEAVLQLDAAGEQVLAADDVAGLGERAELLVAKAADALIATREEADGRWKLAELRGLGVSDLE